MVISQIPALTALTTLRAQHLADQVLADLTPYPMVISQIPVKLIFHYYSESSTFGRPGLGRSTPHQMAILQIPALLWELIFTRPPVKWWFHRFLWNSYFIHTLRAQHLTDQVLAQLPPSSKAISQIPTLLRELIFGRPSVSRICPLSNGNFTDSCSDSSHLMTAHISFPLWELDIWQTRSWQIYHPFLSGNFTDSYSDNYLFHSYSGNFRAYFIWEQTRSLFEWQFGIPIYCPPSTPHAMVISQIPALTAHYSESSTFGRPGLGRYTPTSNGNFTDSCSTLRAHIWQTKCWHIYPP